MKTARLTRKDFQMLANLRLKEAGILVSNREQAGAYYLGGHAVECALKAYIAKKTRRYDFPPDRRHVEKIYTHDLAELLKIAALEKRLDIDMQKNPALAANWGVVKNWDVNSRYKTSGLKGKDMYKAIAGKDGVLPWIKRRW